MSVFFRVTQSVLQLSGEDDQLKLRIAVSILDSRLLLVVEVTECEEVRDKK